MSRRGKNVMKSSRDKNKRHEPQWGERRPARYVTPDLYFEQKGEKKDECNKLNLSLIHI